MQKIELELEDEVKSKIDSELERLGITWIDFIRNVAARQDVMPMFTRAPTVSDQVRVATTKSRLGVWVNNIRRNLDVIDASPDIIDLPKEDGPILCVAAGPSLDLHLNELSEFKGTIISADRNLVKLLEHGIVPKYVVSVESDTEMLKCMNAESPLLDEFGDQMTAILATVVSPEFIERWPGKKAFFNAWLDYPQEYKSTSAIFLALTHRSLMQAGGNAGSTIYFLSQSCLHAKEIALLGLDFAYKVGTPWTETVVWPNIKHLSKKEQETHFYCDTNPFGNTVYTEEMFKMFRDVIFSWMKPVIDDGETEVIQCSDYSILYEEPIQCMNFREYLDLRK